MKLLIITQKVNKNDPILGFFHRWIGEFAKHFDLVTVICLEKGESELPSNVVVKSLGKESGSHSKLFYLLRFKEHIWRERKNYDAVFVHMNPEYIVIGGIRWKLLNKRIALWYTHKSVDLKLRIAAFLADRIYTASAESFRLHSKKVSVVGHGIDTDYFSPGINSGTDTNMLVSVARISPAKNQLRMIEVIKKLRDSGSVCTLHIIGEAITKSDERYEAEIREYIKKNNLDDAVKLLGSVKPEHIASAYQNAGIFLNLSTTGSLDKSVLEAMSCGMKVLTSNEAFAAILPKENITDGSVLDIIEKIDILKNRETTMQLRDIVMRNHSLSALIARLSLELKRLRN